MISGEEADNCSRELKNELKIIEVLQAFDGKSPLVKKYNLPNYKKKINLLSTSFTSINDSSYN